MSRHYDVIVCGAGPAGSSAAARAAERGLRVALFERHVFPRHKPCGGGMPMTVGSVLRDLAPDAFVEADVRAMRHTWMFERPCLAPINADGSAPHLSLWMVRRSVFDHMLADRAVRAGADLHEGVAVQSVAVEGQAVRVRGTPISRGPALEATADHVIGADGANGITARASGLRSNRVLAVAMEVEQEHRWGSGHPDLRRDVIHLEYGAVANGYAWVFPKDDHLNVGAGFFLPRRSHAGTSSARLRLQSAICAYMDALDVRYDRAALRYSAHPLPVWNGAEPVNTRDGRILLAGDAAGLVGPLFGDGILSAVKSGILAADAIADRTPIDYTRRIHTEFAGDSNAARRMARLFYGWTSIIYTHGILRPDSTLIAARLLCGETPFPQVQRRAVRKLRQIVAPRIGVARASS